MAARGPPGLPLGPFSAWTGSSPRVTRTTVGTYLAGPLPAITLRTHTMPHRGDDVNTPGQTCRSYPGSREYAGPYPRDRSRRPVAGRLFGRSCLVPRARAEEGDCPIRWTPCHKSAARRRLVLSRIYTRTGDDGTTALGDGSRAAKTDLRLAAYADVDEANCAIGVAVTMGGLPAEISQLLIRIQNELFDVGADLCNPVAENPPTRRCASARATSTTWSRPCDELQRGPADAAQLHAARRHCRAAALLHVARTVVRRAERAAWAAIGGARRQP